MFSEPNDTDNNIVHNKNILKIHFKYKKKKKKKIDSNTVIVLALMKMVLLKNVFYGLFFLQTASLRKLMPVRVRYPKIKIKNY